MNKKQIGIVARIVGKIEHSRERFAIEGIAERLIAADGDQSDVEIFRAKLERVPRTYAPMDEFDPRSTAEHILDEIREQGLEDVAGFIETDADEIARAYVIQLEIALIALGVDPTQTSRRRRQRAS